MFILAFCCGGFAQESEKVVSAIESDPRLIAEFNDDISEWYKLTPELISIESAKNPSAIGLVRIRNDKNFCSAIGNARNGICVSQSEFKSSYIFDSR